MEFAYLPARSFDELLRIDSALVEGRVAIFSHTLI